MCVPLKIEKNNKYDINKTHRRRNKWPILQIYPDLWKDIKLEKFPVLHFCLPSKFLVPYISLLSYRLMWTWKSFLNLTFCLHILKLNTVMQNWKLTEIPEGKYVCLALLKCSYSTTLLICRKKKPRSFGITKDCKVT